MLTYFLGEQKEVQPYSRSDIMTVTGEPQDITCGTLTVTFFVKKEGDNNYIELSNYNGGTHLWHNDVSNQELEIVSLA